MDRIVERAWKLTDRHPTPWYVIIDQIENLREVVRLGDRNGHTFAIITAGIDRPVRESIEIAEEVVKSINRTASLMN